MGLFVEERCHPHARRQQRRETGKIGEDREDHTARAARCFAPSNQHRHTPHTVKNEDERGRASPLEYSASQMLPSCSAVSVDHARSQPRGSSWVSRACRTLLMLDGEEETASTDAHDFAVDERG
nr:hypothetical protein Iba_scaffold1635879CG0010 [Ipomoea batatas]